MSQAASTIQLHVCQEMSGDPQLEEAVKLHERDAPVPAPIKGHLRMLALKAAAKNATTSPAVKSCKTDPTKK